MDYKIPVENNDTAAAVRNFAEQLFETGKITAALLPYRRPGKTHIMPTLIADAEELKGFEPVSPSFPMNGAKLLSKLSRKKTGGTIAAFLRPCEIRAFVELVKLNQGNAEEPVLIGVDCPGAFNNKESERFMRQHGDDALSLFMKKTASGPWSEDGGFDVMTSCKTCEHPIAQACDIHIGYMGTDGHVHITARTDKGKALLTEMKEGKAELNDADRQKRKDFMDNLIKEKTETRDNAFSETAQTVDNLEKLSDYVSACVNCYNCRVACPVCYCRECVFVTDVFDHEPSRYLKWAKRKGVLKMPSDTVFYHLTRMAHMSTACIGCGQCSNACPNDIPVSDLFRYSAHAVQNAFDYEAGNSFDDKPPLSEFREDEFQDIVGIEQKTA